jgi:hypothetical protein
VKNNIDVAGIATTAGCPIYAAGPPGRTPRWWPVAGRRRGRHRRHQSDQFATGLVGTRSPYGAVRDARRPEFISGGSSSGSAVAVALGLVDIALAPTPPLRPGARRSAGHRRHQTHRGCGADRRRGAGLPVLRLRDGVCPRPGHRGRRDGRHRRWRPTVPARRTAGRPAGRPGGGAARAARLSPEWARLFRSPADKLAAEGVELVEIDLNPFLAAAKLLYDGGLVAERFDAVGEFITAHRDSADLDPTVAGIIAAAGTVPAARLLRDRTRLAELTAVAMAQLQGCHALLVPTTTEHPRIAEVAADPVAVNSRLGTYTNFCNLMDLCGVAVPAGTDSDGAHFGVTVIARAVRTRWPWIWSDYCARPRPPGRRGRCPPGWPPPNCWWWARTCAVSHWPGSSTTAAPAGSDRSAPPRTTGWPPWTPNHPSPAWPGSPPARAPASAANCG